MNFIATRKKVEDQGSPKEPFLTELVTWARKAPDDIFEPRPDPAPPECDVYNLLRPWLGFVVNGKRRWTSLIHRKAAMLELMRVHGGFESSWDWSEAVDKTNRRSMRNKTGEETGLWQVSFDSELLDHGSMDVFCKAHDIDTVDKFIPAMKVNHELCMEYYARLMRESYRWAGPVLRHEVDEYLDMPSMLEFMTLLA